MFDTKRQAWNKRIGPFSFKKETMGKDSPWAFFKGYFPSIFLQKNIGIPRQALKKRIEIPSKRPLENDRNPFKQALNKDRKPFKKGL